MSVLVKTGLGLAGGVILLLTVFAQGVFNAGDAGVGWLYSARGFGVLLGPYLVRSWVGHDPSKMRRAILVAFVVSCLGYLAFSAAPTFWLAALFVMVAHIGTGVLWVMSSTLLQILTPDRLRGRIFAIDFGLNTVTNALSTFLVGVVLEQWDARVVAAAMSVVVIGHAILCGGADVLSRHQHPQAGEAVANGASAGAQAGRADVD